MQSLIQHLIFPEFLRTAPTYVKELKPRAAKYEETPRDLKPPTQQALQSAGIEQLFTHQSQALDVFNAGGNPLIVTPTASGKSLVYQLAILEELQKDPEARFLLIFPLKALEQDQYQRFLELLKTAGLDDQYSIAIMDGDTPKDTRAKLKSNPPNLLLTNPDMLHYGILPNHRSWTGFFRKLRLVVIDELHIYRGIFGSHVLQVLRRLGRICRFYEAQPQWIAGSATIGNPQELAEELTGESFDLIERSGAPASGRHFLLINPVESPYSLTARLLPEIIYQTYKSIVFTKSRRSTELLYKILTDAHPELRSKISSYRAGFLPSERRDIEKRLINDELSAVISTSALELGLDVGGIDVCVLLGYPGTISTLMQRAGRAGRRERESLVILIMGEDALDQYFFRHPEELFLRPSEAAIVDGTNVDILKSHMVCAAAEIPLADREKYLGEEPRKHLQALTDERRLIPGAGGRRWFPGVPRPHSKINIRSMGSTYSIHDVNSGRQIGDIGESRLWSECHPEAIYLHRGSQYLVESIDDAAKTVYARPVDLDYYTMALGEKDTEILAHTSEIDMGYCRAIEGELKVTSRVTGYQKRRIFGGELISSHELDGPPQILITRGFWMEMDDALQTVVEEHKYHYMGSLHAVEHAMISVFPLEVMCDRGDIGGISFTHHPQVEGAAVFIYDAYPGGLGITRRAYQRLDRLAGRTLGLVEVCPCDDGCPSCVHSPRCGAGNRPLDKEGCKLILSKLLDKEFEPAERVAEATESSADNRESVQVLPEVIRKLPETLKDKKILAFDLETQRGPKEVGGWNNAHLMGVSIAVVQDLATGEFKSYREEEIEQLIDNLFSADLVVGFNCIRFDYEVLAGYTGRDFSTIQTVDLLVEVQKAAGKRYRLDLLAELNLGQGKSGSGEDALHYYAEGRWEELESYCRRDVEITADLYYLVVNSGRLLVPGGKVVGVEFLNR
ncbi:DEAD/DEAH box helicase [bacterium]|nr:DEAD/DEAH box helicase [bacterium]MBU1652489.1 DEAD/DEAH box helicase [bacterium]MBU1882138.1 DEAD/DEAH box helicase [bacterium]